jgi:hypothetical protein
MRFSKRKEFKSKENVALFNNIHKANDKVCFYCKKTHTLCEKLFKEEE